MRACFRCGTEVPGDGRVPREGACDGCDQDLRCCRNCRFYEPTLNNQCSEPQAEWVSDKERANFCDLFEMADRERSGRGTVSGADAAREHWRKLFGDG